ncbi:MAG: T9SS type A sorting domain-containing protein [bacterium]
MKKYLILIAFAFLFPYCTQLYANTWTKTFGGTGDDYCGSVQQTSDKGYIMCGMTECNAWLIKTDSLGNTVWTKTYGGTDYDEGSSVQQTEDGGYIVAGTTHLDSSDYGNAWLIKTNSMGDTLWTRRFGGSMFDAGRSVQQTKDKGYIIAGQTGSYGAGNSDVWLIKTDSIGDTLWTRTFGGTGRDEGRSVRQTIDGGYIVGGLTYSYGAGISDMWLIKTDSAGNSLWTKTFGGDSCDEGGSVQQTTDGGYIITGFTWFYSTSGWKIYSSLIKTNNSGDTVWTRIFNETGVDYILSAQQTRDSGYILTGVIGWTGSYKTGNGDVWLIKTNSSGDTLWTRTFGGDTLDGGSSVQQTADGGFIIVGSTYSFGAGNEDVYLIKTDSLGNVGVEENTPLSGRDVATLQITKNPFVKSTVIKYFIPVRTRVILSVYDISGSCVKTLVDGEKAAGSYSSTLNAKELKTGIYFVRLTTDIHKLTKKLILMK